MFELRIVNDRTLPLSRFVQFERIWLLGLEFSRRCRVSGMDSGICYAVKRLSEIDRLMHAIRSWRFPSPNLVYLPRQSCHPIPGRPGSISEDLD